MLRATDLTFAYEGQASPYFFSLFAAPGEITAVSGASGSGKSTLLDLLAGFLRPASGSLDLDGADLIAKSPEDRSISLLLQTDNLFDHLSAADNAALGLPAGTSRQDRKLRVSAALSEVGLGGLETRVAAQLSGGQKQRVALARTLLRNRPVLLLDEPFSALDDETRRSTRAMVLDMTRRQNWHTVLVSHHQDDIEALASRHYRLTQGRLVEA